LERLREELTIKLDEGVFRGIVAPGLILSGGHAMWGFIWFVLAGAALVVIGEAMITESDVAEKAFQIRAGVAAFSACLGAMCVELAERNLRHPMTYVGILGIVLGAGILAAMRFGFLS